MAAMQECNAGGLQQIAADSPTTNPKVAARHSAFKASWGSKLAEIMFGRQARERLPASELATSAWQLQVDTAYNVT